MRHEDQLASVTCWMGHQQDSEQWVHRKVRLPDGRELDEYECRCECGETMTELFNGEGKIVEESSDSL